MGTDLEGNEARAACVVVAAGDGTRLGRVDAAGRRKALVELAGRPLVEHALLALDAARSVREVVIVAHREDVRTLERWCAERPAFAKVVAVVPGGASRSESVRRGTAWTSFSVDVVCVHDAARPLVDPARVDEVVAVAARDGAALLAVPAGDTVKRSEDGSRAVETLDRSRLWYAQTPQAFGAARFRELLARAAAEAFEPTDDAALWERYLGPVTLVPADPTNLKITVPADLEIAEALLARRTRREGQEA